MSADEKSDIKAGLLMLLEILKDGDKDSNEVEKESLKEKGQGRSVGSGMIIFE